MSSKKRRVARVAPTSPRGAVILTPDRDWVLIAVLALAFAARLGVLLALRDHPLLQPRPGLDSAAYLELAHRVAAGDLLAGNRVFFLSPFYIYFAATVLALTGGSIFALQLAQVGLGVAAVWFVADTARVWFGRRGARVAAVLAAATGYFAFQESLVLQSAVDPCLTAAGLWAVTCAWTTGRPRLFLAAGVILGLHTLNRPNIALWAVAALVLTAAKQLRGTRTDVARSSSFAEGSSSSVESVPRPRSSSFAAPALALGLALVLLPVAVRNFAVAGEIALVSSHGGLNFYIGNNPRADGTYRPVPGITPSIEGQSRDMQRVAEQESGRAMTEVEASSWFYGKAFDWIRREPGAAAALFAKKLLYVFNATDIPLNESYAFYATDESWLLRLLVVGPWLLLPLGLAGAWFGRPRTLAATPVAWWLSASFIPVYALSVTLFFVTGRYRLPILVACCVLATGCLLWLLDRVRARCWRETAPAVATMAVAGVVAALPLGLDNGLAGWREQMILHQIRSGQDADAHALLAKTEAAAPHRSLLLYRVGRAWLARGEAGRALALFERARSLAPARREPELEIGEALLQLNRAPEAIRHLEAARDVEGREDEATLALARARAVSGQPDAALSALAAVRAPDALNPASQLMAGKMALELERPAIAEPFLARAVSAASDNPEAREAYGLALAALGRRQDATAQLDAASRLDPGNAGVRMNLAILYAQAGRFDEARAQATEALKLRPDDDRPRQFLASLPR